MHKDFGVTGKGMWAGREMHGCRRTQALDTNLVPLVCGPTSYKEEEAGRSFITPPHQAEPALRMLFLVFGPSLMSHVLGGILRSFILHHVC